METPKTKWSGETRNLNCLGSRITMIKKIVLENWKSFRHAELYIDPLTVIIGTNASGKSNLVEAFEFLKRIASGETIDVALNGEKKLSSIRGGTELIINKNSAQSQFKIQVDLDSKILEGKELIYTGEFGWESQLKYIQLESLAIEDNAEQRIPIFESGVTGRNYSFFLKIISSEQIKNFDDYLKKISGTNSLNEINENQFYADFLNYQCMSDVQKTLASITILEPMPHKMRDYSRLSEAMAQDGSNIAGFLAALSDPKKSEVETEITHYLEHFPEGDIKKVWAEKVGRLGTDAMLYCQEEWRPGEIMEIDARSMSDGTLRFIGILTALLTCPVESLIIIEEIDNGLHPSRAELLVKVLREIGAKRKIDLLITTPNPALLDALGPEIIPFVTVAHRDPETGDSQLTLLENLDHLPKLLAQGSLGTLATTGAIEKRLANAAK